MTSLQEIKHKLCSTEHAPDNRSNPSRTNVTVTPNITKENYLDNVKKALEYIAAGDIYQINLSQRLRISMDQPPAQLYINMLNQNPARFSSFMDCGPFQIISNSPERLLSISGGVIETEPIKGTAPRGDTPAQDEKLKQELLDNPKERAEHLMIVDLERSDIGKLSQPGSVEVKNFGRIETYPTVHHMVSTVWGRLKNGSDPALTLKDFSPEAPSRVRRR